MLVFLKQQKCCLFRLEEINTRYKSRYNVCMYSKEEYVVENHTKQQTCKNMIIMERNKIDFVNC